MYCDQSINPKNGRKTFSVHDISELQAFMLYEALAAYKPDGHTKRFAGVLLAQLHQELQTPIDKVIENLDKNP